MELTAESYWTDSVCWTDQEEQKDQQTELTQTLVINNRALPKSQFVNIIGPYRPIADTSVAVYMFFDIETVFSAG